MSKMKSVVLLVIALSALLAVRESRADCCDEYEPTAGNIIVNARTKERVYHVCPVCSAGNNCYYKEETRHGLEGCFDDLDGGASSLLSFLTGSYCCGNGGCNVFCCNCDGGCKGQNCPAAEAAGALLLPQASLARTADSNAVALFNMLDGNGDCYVDQAEFVAWFVKSAQNGTHGVEAELADTFSDASLHANATVRDAYAAKAARTVFATMDTNFNHKLDGVELDFSLAHHKCKKRKTASNTGRRLKL